MPYLVATSASIRIKDKTSGSTYIISILRQYITKEGREQCNISSNCTVK